MKRVLVTGGAGFLGSHLCESLVNARCEVICLDNLSTGSKDNVRHLMSNPNFEFIRHDVVDSINLEVDQIYNLACPASPPHYQKNPVKTADHPAETGGGLIHILCGTPYISCFYRFFKIFLFA